VIADSVDRAKREEGELRLAIEEGAIAWESVLELGSVVAGSTPGRTADDEITYVTSGGLATETLVLARGVEERARERDVGTYLDLPTPDQAPLP
jgi:ornithine cyclodeaminase/alanine dehydrogenase-like protein (mu-crystallin family)